MKKKGSRSIPDFSSKRKGQVPGAPPASQTGPVKTPREPTVKPQTTSAKSGRRGQ